jgi:2-oxoglutarate dehydrogenase E2 component (dihydrolipoamide succinyltransferase)
MARVITNIPNASDNIDGIVFSAPDRGERISAEIPDDVAARFVAIKGFRLVPPQPAPRVKKEAAPPPPAPEPAPSPPGEQPTTTPPAPPAA